MQNNLKQYLLVKLANTTEEIRQREMQKQAWGNQDSDYSRAAKAKQPYPGVIKPEEKGLTARQAYNGCGDYDKSYEKAFLDSADEHAKRLGITDPTRIAELRENMRQLGALSDMGFGTYSLPGSESFMTADGSKGRYPAYSIYKKKYPNRTTQGFNTFLNKDVYRNKYTVPGLDILDALEESRAKAHRYSELIPKK